MAKKTKKDKTVANLRRSIARSLRKQGFVIEQNKIKPLGSLDKAALRALHQTAVLHRLSEETPYLRAHEDQLLSHVANGADVVVDKISPRLVQVVKGQPEATLFRYLQLHWSIPVSRGYGRRLRFLVIDENNGKVMGLIGLGDPVYSLGVRDRWIGWDSDTKKEKLYHVMDAYVLGAIPPYSHLIGSKLIALLALSNEVRQAFKERYAYRKSLMLGQVRPPYLALITTASALGRSSTYNRLKVAGVTYWHRLGFTGGSGDFHFANGQYARMRDFAEEHCEPTAKASLWGKGFRNRREVIGKCLQELGLPNKLAYHNVSREVFAAPCGAGSLEFLRNERKRPQFFDWNTSSLFDVFRDRWLLSRAERDCMYKAFTRDQYRLWRDATP
jgi:hypothetical protein